MDEPSSPAELRLEDLLWLRDLSRRLVEDPHLAEDAVQDTVVAALTRGPRSARSLRAWLGSVLRNAVRQERRGRARRDERERRSGGPKTAPSTLEVVEELALHRRLVELVHALDEPYRTTLVHRYLHGKSPREIARAAGVPVKTVHTRIERGVSRLRERLDREYGGERGAWVALLAPMLDEKALGLGLGSLVIPMNVKPIALVLGAAVLGVLAYVPFSGSPASGSGVARPDSARSAEVEGSADSAGGATGEGPVERRSVGAPLAPAPVTASEPDPIVRVGGFVRELDGRPVPGLDLVFQPRRGDSFETGEPVARSAVDGSFSLTLPDRAGRLTVSTELYTALVRPYVDGAQPPVPPVVVVAPRREYSGRVVDTSGDPIANASVQATLPGGWLQAFQSDHGPVHLLLPLAQVRTGADGTFTLDAVGLVDGARLEAERDGFETSGVELPPSSSHGIELVLALGEAPARALFGVVRDSNGAPVEGAYVSLGWDSVLSDAAGRFALEVFPWQDVATLRAVKRGFVPAAHPFVAAQESRGTGPEDPIELFLGSDPPAIRGRVVDEGGDPVPGVCVWTPDTTYFGQASYERGDSSAYGVVTVEGLVTGQLDSTTRALETWTDEDGAPSRSAASRRSATPSWPSQPGSLAAADARRSSHAGDDDLESSSCGERENARRVAGRVVTRCGRAARPACGWPSGRQHGLGPP